MAQLIGLVAALGLVLVSGPARAACSSVTQSSGNSRIGFQFSAEVDCGQFANGDPWVIGPVTITSLSPTPSGGRHGWQVNPWGSSNGYDQRIAGYDATLQPRLPYTAQPGDSIIKTISKSGGACRTGNDFNCLEFATVLTVLDAPPPDRGATVFRPPYYSGEKPLHRTTSLRTDLLPSLAPVGGGTPSLRQVEDRYRFVQLDHGRRNFQIRQLIPSKNFDSEAWTKYTVSEYGAEIARDSADAALRFMLNDPLPEKMPALIAYVQAGIDYYYAMKEGHAWPAEAGLLLGRKLAPVFAAVMLDDDEMKAGLRKVSGRNQGRGERRFNTFSEDGQLVYSPDANGGKGQVLWGERSQYWSESAYTNYIETGKGSRQHQDPYGYIDGGKPGDSSSYQFCCTSKAYVATAIALVLMPELAEVWNNPDFIAYADRWVNHGAWYAPDPKGRATDLDGKWKNSGFYDSGFGDTMYARYRKRPPKRATPAPSSE